MTERTATQAYEENLEAIKSALATIQAALKDYTKAARREGINWAHVGDLARWREQLDDVQAALTHTGEYAEVE